MADFANLPWTTDSPESDDPETREECSTVVDSAGCDLMNGGHTEHATASLWASAPKMQAACEWLLPHFEEAVRDGGDHFEQRFCEEVVKRLRDALAPHV
jgi:hypothetical protein